MKMLNKKEFLELKYFREQIEWTPNGGSIYNIYLDNEIKAIPRKNFMEFLSKYKFLYKDSAFPTFTKI